MMSIRSGAARLANGAIRAGLPRPSRSMDLHSFANSNTFPPVTPALFGQPSSPSHPHLLQPKEVTPGITKDEYKTRRQRLIDSLPDDSPVVVCLSSTVKVKPSESTPYSANIMPANSDPEQYASGGKYISSHRKYSYWDYLLLEIL